MAATRREGGRREEAEGEASGSASRLFQASCCSVPFAQHTSFYLTLSISLPQLRAQSIHGRELELVRGHTEYRFTGWISVSATSPEQLDAACALVEQAAVRSALVVRRVYGEVDQAFLAAALPLNEGVR